MLVFGALIVNILLLTAGVAWDAYMLVKQRRQDESELEEGTWLECLLIGSGFPFGRDVPEEERGKKGG